MTFSYEGSVDGSWILTGVKCFGTSAFEFFDRVRWYITQ